MSMTVGELVAFLRLDDGQFNRGLDQAHSKIGRVGGAVGTAFKRGAIVAGAAVAGLVGTALVKGFQRLSSIENATAKLKGLGHSAAEVQLIMDNALASVKGTAFGLDEAATIAATTVAAGVKPGQDLEKTLRLVADAATISGGSLAEMGAIFNKVAASNKIQGDVIAQLNDAGIPIVQLLGKELGKTSAEVVALASAGKIHFAEFQKAMERGLGGAALASGGTTIGSWKNMMAALSRLGASALSGIFPSFKVAFAKVTTYLDQIAAKYGDKFKKWGEKVSAAFKTGGFTGMFKAMLPAGVGDTLITTFNVIKDTTVAIVKVLSTIGKVFGLLPGALQKFAIAAGVLALALNKFGLLGSAKGLLGGLLGKGGGAATEVPLTTAVGLNTAATEANTLALMGKGVLPGGGNTPLPVGTPGGTKPTGGLSGLLGKLGLVTMGFFGAKAVGDLMGPSWAEERQIAREAGKDSGQAFADAFDPLASIKPDLLGTAGGTGPIAAAVKSAGKEGKKAAAGLAAGLDPAIERTQEKLATLRKGFAPGEFAAGKKELASFRALAAKGTPMGPLTHFGERVAAVQRLEKKLANLRTEAAKPAHTGRLNTAGWTGPLSAAARALASFRDLASAGITPSSMSQHAPSRRSVPAPAPVWHAPGRAAGGNVSGPSSGYPVIMHGEETVVAHNNPSRGLADLAAAGIGGGGLTIRIDQVVGTDERSARRLADQVGQILMSKQRMKGAMARG